MTQIAFFILWLILFLTLMINDKTSNSFEMKMKGIDYYAKVTLIIWSLLQFARREELLRYMNEELQQDIMFIDWFLQMKSNLGSQMLLCPDIVYLIYDKPKEREPHKPDRYVLFGV